MTCIGSAPGTTTNTAQPRSAGIAISRMPASGFAFESGYRGLGWNAIGRLSRLHGRASHVEEFCHS